MATNTVTPASTAAPPANVVIEESIVPFHGSVITSESESVAEKMLLMENTGLILSDSIDEIAPAVKDQVSYDQAAEVLKRARQFVKESDEFFEPIRGLTYNLYQRVLARKKAIQSAVNDRLRGLTEAIIRFEKAREEEAKRLQRDAVQKQEQAHIEQNLESAIAAEQAGMDAKSVEQIMTQPSSAPTPPPQATFQRAAGTSRRENWAAEVHDFHALVKHVAKNPSMLPLLYNYDPDKMTSPNLNAQAKSLKNSMNVTGCLPGVRAVDKGVLAVRA